MTHKNKTLATLLAASLGGIGAYRFYLRGSGDKLGWAHASCAIVSICLILLFPNMQPFFALLPLIISSLSGLLAALILGLSPDEKWDAKFNPNSTKKSDSRWPLAILVALSFTFAAFGLIATMARTFDLLFTGGAFG